MAKNPLAKKPLDGLPEAFVSNAAIASAVSRAVAQGRIRQIGTKLYTFNLDDAPERIVRRSLWGLVASYVPGALIADRTAIENRPASDGSIFLVSNRKRDIVLPGITIRSRSGAPPLESDRPFVGGLFLSSTARGFLDNMIPSRRRSGDVSRTLTRVELEGRLDDIVRRSGADGLNALRDEARRIAPLIDRETEYAALDRLIGALLGTREDRLASERGSARGAGAPCDPDRIKLFEALHTELRATAPFSRPVEQRPAEARSTHAFYEAYFSNFIEGTEFDVSEAADIVFNNVIPRDRPEDAHDVLGTWQIVSDSAEMARMPRAPYGRYSLGSTTGTRTERKMLVPGAVRSRVTMDDVAELAGVSLKSVSRVVNGEAHVSDKLRAKVTKAVEALGYVPDVAARSLAGARSFTVAVLFDNPSPNYNMKVQAGAYQACRDAGYHLRIDEVNSACPDGELVAQITAILQKGRCDGFVLTPPLSDDPRVLDVLEREGKTYVRIAPVLDPGRSSAVETNDHEAAAEVARLFHKLGHRRIAIVNGPESHGRSAHRRDGFLQAIGRLVPDAHVLEERGDFTFYSGIAAGMRLLERCKPPLAVFATNDDMAAGVMNAAQRAGYRVPEDVSVCGFDDGIIAMTVWPYLTTIHQPVAEMAGSAVKMLIGEAREMPMRKQIPSYLVKRDSMAGSGEPHIEVVECSGS
jgi:LacI family transcriptional regulator